MVEHCLPQDHWSKLAGDGQGVEQEAIDGEVAALDVFFGAQGVAHRIGMAAVGVSGVGAEGGDFGGKVAVAVIVGNADDAEVGPYGEGAREHGENDIWRGAGGDVEVFRGAAQQQVADAAAGEIGFIARRAQLGDDLEGCFEFGRGREHVLIHCYAVGAILANFGDAEAGKLSG